MGIFMTIKPIRFQFKIACELLDISCESFTRALKMCESKQNPVFFDYAELMEWHEKQKLSLRNEEV